MLSFTGGFFRKRYKPHRKLWVLGFVFLDETKNALFIFFSYWLGHLTRKTLQFGLLGVKTRHVIPRKWVDRGCLLLTKQNVVLV